MPIAKTMRKQWAFACLLMAALQLRAQLPSGSVAPDFMATDLNGQKWHLYDLLAQGKTVVLEISATWCPPCWAYHNSHAMHHFFEEHGPGGDGSAMVLFVEGDPQTNTNCLHGSAGCNDVTLGNWVAGTPFPIINSDTIAKAFQVKYFPTIFIICPNRKAYEVGQWSAADLWEQAQSCPVAAGQNNAGIFDFSAGTPLREVCDDLKVQPGLSLINLGSQALTQATVALQWNNTTVQTIEWSGNLGLYGEALIAFDPYWINAGGTLETRLTYVNYAPTDDEPQNNAHSTAFSAAQNFNTQQVLLKIRTDQYGAETYWELRDEAGQVLDSGGNQSVGPNGGGKFTGITGGPGAYGNNMIIRDTLTLPASGCYSIHFVDAYGDGMCCSYGNGYYRLYNLDDPLTEIISGGMFRAYDDRGFGVGIATSTSESAPSALELELYPNPAGEQIVVDFVLPQSARLSLSVVNALGQVVLAQTPFTAESGAHQRVLHTGMLPDGLYWLHLLTDGAPVSKKFVVRR